MELITYRPPPGTWLALDTVAVLTDDQLDAFHADGYRVIFGYSRRDGKVLDNPVPGGEYGDAVANGCNSLALSTSRRYLAHGFALSLVQFGAFGSTAYGNEMGLAAASVSRGMGFPGGHHHFCDVEGNGPQMAGPAKVTSYVEALAGSLMAGGDGAPIGGLYYNFTCLSPRQLYALAGITCYWGAAGPWPPEPYYRGKAVQQRVPETIHGVQIDTDTIRQDHLGDGPVVIATPEIAAAWDAEALAKLLSRQFAQVP